LHGIRLSTVAYSITIRALDTDHGEVAATVELGWSPTR